MSALYDIPITGGAATASFTSAADNSQVLDFNPSVDEGGTQTVSTTASPSTSNPQSLVPVTSSTPAGVAAPAAAAAAAAAPSSTLIWLAIGGALLLMLMPSRGRR